MNKKGPSFLQFESPWYFDPGTIRLPSPPDGLSAEEAAQCLRAGQLTQPYILETESERRLHFSQCNVQSVMSLDEPHALVSAYTRKMMGFMLFKPAPKSIVMVGLGGGSLAKFCYRYLPKTQITVVEIDERVIELRDEFCVPADDHRFRIVCDDGARTSRIFRRTSTSSWLMRSTRSAWPPHWRPPISMCRRLDDCRRTACS